MSIKCVSVSKNINGHIIAREIVNTYGAMIVAENTVITDYIREKLMDLDIQQVWIYEPSMQNKPSDDRFHAFKLEYEKNILQLKQVINQLASGKQLNMNSLMSISDSIYTNVNDTEYIIQCLNKIRISDEYTYSHSINVSFYAMLIGKWFQLGSSDIHSIIQAGLLHDIGKTMIPGQLLNKKEKLLPEEFDLIKKHTIFGYNIVKNIHELSEDIRNTILMHHEREDNQGYPNGLSGHQVNLYTKIIAVADVFDAMTSDRIYKKRATPFEAFEMFETVGVKSFDTTVVRKFLTHITAYYTGSKVLLNTGDIGEIVYIPPHSISKPIVNVNSTYIDFSLVKDCCIACML